MAEGGAAEAGPDGGLAAGALELLLELQLEASAAGQSPGDAVALTLTPTPAAGAAAPDAEPDLAGRGARSLGTAGRVCTRLEISVDPALLAGPPGEAAAAPRLLLAVPTGELWPLVWHEPPLLLRLPSAGWHRLMLEAPGGASEVRFHLSSPLAEYTEALDDFSDALAWSWDGSNWTEALDEATLDLAVGVDDFMEKLGTMMGPLQGSGMLGGGLGSLVETPRRQLETQLGRALDGHDANAVSMMHTAVRDLLMQAGALAAMAPALGADDVFSRAAAAFELARQEASSPESRQLVSARLRRLLCAGQAYVAWIRGRELSGLHVGSAGSFARQWEGPRGLAEQLAASEGRAVEVATIVALHSGGGSVLADMMGKVFGQTSASEGPPVSAQTVPFLDLGEFSRGLGLMGLVARWSEDLVNGVAIVGSPMQPMCLSSGAPGAAEASARLLQRLMSLGFGYVAQADPAAPGPAAAGLAQVGALAAVLDRTRATLPLRARDVFVGDRKRKARNKCANIRQDMTNSDMYGIRNGNTCALNTKGAPPRRDARRAQPAEARPALLAAGDQGNHLSNTSYLFNACVLQKMQSM